jgi:hypothetical protein
MYCSELVTSSACHNHPAEEEMRIELDYKIMGGMYKPGSSTPITTAPQHHSSPHTAARAQHSQIRTARPQNHPNRANNTTLQYPAVQ